MSDTVHLIPGTPDGNAVIITSQITLCCKTWVGDNRIKVGTINPDAVTCTGDITQVSRTDEEDER